MTTIRSRRTLVSQPPAKRSFLRAAVAAIVLWSAACGDGGTGPAPAPAPNRAPLASGAISPQTVAAGQTVMVNVASYFTDPDGDALTFSATSSNAGTASVSVSGSVVTVTAAARGVATVTVTARDSGGLSAQVTFTVTVPNQAPVAVDDVPAQTIFVGDTVSVDVSAHFDDPDGDALSFTATSGNAEVVSVIIAESAVTIIGVAPGATMVTVTAADPDGMSAEQTIAVAVPNREPVAVDNIPGQLLEIGETVVVDVSPFFNDPDDETLSYSAASSSTGIATVTVAGSSVTIAGEAAGTATITVTAMDPGQLVAQQRFSVTVRAAKQAPEVVSTIPDLTMTVGETRTWMGADHFRDPNGDALSYAAGSSNAAVVLALVSGGGFGIGAVSAGSAVVTVTASDPGGLSAQLSFRVTVQPKAQAAVLISGVNPVVLVEGQEARVTGSGFSATAAQNQVSVGGRGARVTAATSTSLTITVPRADCLPPRREELRVTVGSKSDARAVGVSPRSQQDMELEPGWYRSTYAGHGCVYLPADVSGGEYLIGVVSSSEDPASLTGVTLTGTPGDATVVGADGGRMVVAAERGGRGTGRGAMTALAREPFRAVAAFDQGTVRSTARSAPGFEQWPLADDTLRIKRARVHNEIMARNQALLRRLGRLTPPALADARRDLKVGDTLTLYADSDATCSSAGQVRAVVRLVGSSSIWLDDLDNPAATFTDTELANLDAFYSANIKGVHDDYFGRLSDVDGNGRFLVLMTKEVNRVEHAQGWVRPFDLRSHQSCATSNQAEIFYGKVPDPRGSVGDTATKQQLLDSYPALIAHEVTHIVQAGAYFSGAGGRQGKLPWEWEGGATLAEQLVGYRLFRHGSGQELDWSALAPWEERHHWYWGWLFELAQFFGWDSRGDGAGRISSAPEECSWVGTPDEGNSGPCQLGGRAIYGVPSMVLRYAMDRWGGDYPGGERALMRRLTQSPAQGFASLVDVSPESAWPSEQVLADFYMTLWIDLQGWGALGMTTWDLHDVFSNLRPNMRLQPYTSSSRTPRLTGRRVRAGSSLYFHWTPTGSLSPTAIKVTSASGGPVPDHVSVWAFRTR